MLFSALILCVSLCVYVCAFLLLPHKFQHCYILGTYTCFFPHILSCLVGTIRFFFSHYLPAAYRRWDTINKHLCLCSHLFTEMPKFLFLLLLDRKLKQEGGEIVKGNETQEMVWGNPEPQD